MEIKRVALIYDDRPRPETTGRYCLSALAKLVEVVHVLPGEWDRAGSEPYDLYLAIDDGLRYELPDDWRPAAWWAIDTHLDFEWCLQRSKQFDHVFAAQRDGAQRLREAGIADVTWLPLACDPDVHRRHEVSKEHDVAFVGNLFPGERQELVEMIRERFERVLVGNRYFDEMAKAFSASKIVFNRSVRKDVNMRVFEALSCGSLLVTNDLEENGQEELFRGGEHCVTYRGQYDLVEKMAYYLKHDDEREAMAAAGRRHAHEHHTYRHRMQQVLERLTNLRPRTKSGKSTTYFSFSRPEILALVPESSQRVLDIGCGAGRLGESIKQRQGAHVSGIEVVADAADQARRRLDEVHVVDIESPDVQFEAGRFDTIVCGDVLEHLRDPLAVLRKFRGWLSPAGTLVASIPNARHHSVVRGLVEGNWTYEPAGLLDATHLRFFTRREMEKLFFRAGYEIETTEVVPGPGYREWQEQGSPGEVRIGGLQIGGLSRDEAEEFFAYQYLFRARPRELPDHGLTSIVILTHNQLGYTRECVESILEYTDEPVELVFVDNASTDGTPEYLQSIEGAKVILNEENMGFPAGCNQGIEICTGRQILLLNNDVVVTTGWLERLLAALYREQDIGMTGPCSNQVSGPQQVPADYQDAACLDGFAWQWRKNHLQETVEEDRLVGFCLLIRREVVDRIGLLDEQFGMGNFEDDDYCCRARQAGFRCVIARDSFIHHYGGRTFVGSGVDYKALLEKNKRLFREKWLTGPKEQTLAETRRFRLEAHPAGGLRLVRDEILVSLCMIVRDNEKTIVPCLESIRPWVDEMVVVDTGSKDRTPQIAEELGARLFHFPWCDDFSAARNESVKYARGKWIFWMDSDDTIEPDCGRTIRETAKRTTDPNLMGFVMQVHCPGATPNDVTAVDHVKLFRNRPDLRFEGRIHEQIIPAIRAAGGEVGWTDAYVVHSGSDRSPEGRLRKLERDFRILKQELKERPDHPFVLFNLGMTHEDADQHEEAIGYLRRCLEVSSPSESHVRKAYALLVASCAAAGRHDDTWTACQEGLKLYPQDIELHFRAGLLHHHFGRLEDAVRSYQTVLAPAEERHFTSVDRGIGGYKARQNLAVVYSDMQRWDLAEREWRTIVDEVPDYRDAWHGLAESLFRQQKHAEIEVLARRLKEMNGLSGLGVSLEARLVAQRGQTDEAVAGLEKAVVEANGDLEPLRTLCQLLFEAGRFEDAAHRLSNLIKRDGDDPAVMCNLGTAQMRSGRHTQAIETYRRSLALRPESAGTHLLLGYALEGAGRTDDARSAWRECLRLAPGNAEAAELLRQHKGKT